MNPNKRIKCPKCRSGNNIVDNNKYVEENDINIRSRKCLDCGNRFNTIEMIESNYEASTMIAKGLIKLIKENLIVEEDE